MRAPLTLADEFTPNEIKQALARPRDFGWFGDDETFTTWALGPVIQHRDSGLIDRSNAAVMQRWLAEAAKRGEIEPDSWRVVSASHWAVGWVEHLSYRVIDEEGSPTRVARWVRAFNEELDRYPIADEDDHGERCMEAEVENVDDAARWCKATKGLIDSLPVGWQGEVASLLSDRGQMHDDCDRGAYPESDEALVAAFRELGYLPAEDADESEGD